MIVQTVTGKRGTVVRVTNGEHQAARVWVRLWLHIGGTGHVPAKVIVAYAPEDVVEVRGPV